MSRRRITVGILAAIVAGALAAPSAASAASPTVITIEAATPGSGNCFPFGGYLADGGGWGPYFVFVYKDIPAFNLRPGDIVAYDLNLPNDTDNRMDVAMAATTANGNDVNNGPFTTVASNTQTPANPRGDSVTDNYELQWTASAAFDFAGGGLLVRFSNPAGDFATDGSCDASMVSGDAPDASGFFVERTYGDADGVSPWGITDSGDIGQFRLILESSSSPIAPEPTSSAIALGKIQRNTRNGTASLPVTVPGPGTLTLGGKGVKARTASSPVARTSVAAAGTVMLAIKARGKTKSKLLKSHKARVVASVTFAPSAIPGHPAGNPSTLTTKVKLIQR
jgi:hypothetical protein